MAISIGKLRQRIEIQKYLESTDTTTGEKTETWIPNERVWASIEPLQGQERFLAQQVRADVSHRITIRYLPGLSAKDRIVHNERIFNVSAIINIDERDAELQLMCSERI